jgi:hypothetical protein
MTLAYQHFSAVLLLLLLLFLIYDSPFVSCIYYCLRVFWCAAARISELKLKQQTNINFLLNLERVKMKSDRCWCKFAGIKLWRKKQFTNGLNVFLREEKVSLTKRDQDGQQQAELNKTLQTFV